MISKYLLRKIVSIWFRMYSGVSSSDAHASLIDLEKILFIRNSPVPIVYKRTT